MAMVEIQVDAAALDELNWSALFQTLTVVSWTTSCASCCSLSRCCRKARSPGEKLLKTIRKSLRSGSWATILIKSLMSHEERWIARSRWLDYGFLHRESWRTSMLGGSIIELHTGAIPAAGVRRGICSNLKTFCILLTRCY